MYRSTDKSMDPSGDECQHLPINQSARKTHQTNWTDSHNYPYTDPSIFINKYLDDR